MKVYYLSIVILSIASSCSKKQNKNTELKILKGGQLSISLDMTVNPSGTNFQYIDSDSGEFLAIENKIGPAIELYNLKDGSRSLQIKLNREGPNGVGNINGFRFFSLDTLLLAAIPPKILTIDFEGRLINHITVKDSTNHVNYLSSNNEIPFLFGDDEIFGAQPFFRNFFHMATDEISNYSHIYTVNFNSKKVEWLSISHPNDMWDSGKKSEHFSWTDRYDSIIVSPQMDHRLWIVSKKERKLLGYKEVKSSHVNQFQIIRGMPEGDKGIIEALQSDRYELIKYDQYRDVFYRFFFPGFNWEDFGTSYRDLFSNRPLIGIMVLDKNLKTLGEFILDKHYAAQWNYFVGKKGLYISTNNPNRDDFDENFLRYDIIRFEGLEYED